ncbi:MAG: PQQ-binding-like beta-propeller repeat protein [Acidobacteriota bacterium]|nr:PQQ-binding-like beta-propeller repeat protein [Acidobacteriota bacterium]
MRIVRRVLAGIVFSFLLCGRAAALPVRFAVIADTHVGSGAAAVDLAALVAKINADPSIRFVVVDGDVTEKGRDEEFREAKSILGRLKAPVHVLPGNHDTHWTGFGGAGFVEIFGGDRFAFEADGIAFLGLNAWDQGHFAPDDVLWLETQVRKLPADADVFFFVHFPPGSIDNWARVHEALRTRRTIVVAGHIHADGQSLYHGLPVWTVREAFGKNGEPPGMAVITADAATFEIARPAEDGILRLWGSFSRRGREPAKAFAQAAPLPPRVDVLWRRDLGRRLPAPPAFDGKRLYAADQRGRITCWDEKGKEIWTFEAKAPLISRPAVQGKFLLAASVDGQVFKLDAGTGYAYVTAGLGLHPISPIVAFVDERGKVARFWLGTSSGRLLCLNAFNLTSFWTSDAARGAIQSAPLRVGRTVVYGAWDGAAHGVEAETGRELWRWTENDQFYYSPAGCAPVTDGRRAFFCSPDGNVSAVDAGTGKTVWRVAAAAWESLGLSADGRRVLVKSRLDEFHVLDAANGRTLRKIAPAHGADDLEPGAPIEWKGRILYGARTGRILSIDESGRVETLLDLGPGGIHTLIAMGGGRFAASNVDGTVTVFRVRD